MAYLAEAGKHSLHHQRGTSDLHEIRDHARPMGAATSCSWRRGDSCTSNLASCQPNEAGLGRARCGFVDMPAAHVMDVGGQLGSISRVSGRKMRYGWQSWGRRHGDTVEGGDESEVLEDTVEKSFEAPMGIGSVIGASGGARLSEGLQVRAFLELHGKHLMSVSYLKHPVACASANVALHLHLWSLADRPHALLSCISLVVQVRFPPVQFPP